MAGVKTFRRAVVLILIVATVAAILPGALRSHEPSYQGRPLSAWLTDLEEGTDEKAQFAKEAVRHMGTNAIPPLLRMMQREDSKLQQNLIWLIQRQRIIKFRVTDATEQHLRASLGFVALGPIGQPSLFELARLISNPNTTRFTATALAAIGNDGVRAVTGALLSTNVLVRREAAGVLGGLGIVRFATNSTPKQLEVLESQARLAVPSLVAACDDPDELVRARAATALGLLGAKSELAVPALIKALADGNSPWRVPSASARALGRFGSNAIPAIPALRQVQKSQDLRVSQAAAIALEAIGESESGNSKK